MNCAADPSAQTSDPLISVVIPCFNAADTLEETLRSLRAQTCPDWEAVVVDDGSTDSSRAIAESLADEDPRFRVVCHDRNRGLAPARNTAIGEARGKFIKFLDADDLLLPQGLQKLLEVTAARPECAGVYGGWISFFPDGEEQCLSLAQEDEVTFEALCHHNLIHIQGILLRTSVLRAGYLFDEAFADTPGAEDWDLWIRLYRGGHRLARLQDPVVRYRVRPQSMSGHFCEQWLSCSKTIELNHGHDPRCPEALPEYAEGPGDAARDAAHVYNHSEHLKWVLMRGDCVAMRRIAASIQDLGLPPPDPVHLGDALMYSAGLAPEGHDPLLLHWRKKTRDIEAALRLLGGPRHDFVYLILKSVLNQVPSTRHSWHLYKRLRRLGRAALAAHSGPSVGVAYDWCPYPIRSGDNRRVSEMIQALRNAGFTVHLIMTRPLELEDQRRCYQHVDYLHMYRGRLSLKRLFRWGIAKVNGICWHLKLPTLNEMAGRILRRRKKLYDKIISTLPPYPIGLDPWLGRIARQAGLDNLVVNYAWLNRAVDQLPDSTLKLLDTHDVMHLRRQELAKGGYDISFKVTREEECAIYRKFDILLAIQREEEALIREMVPEQRVVVVGTSTTPSATPDVEERPGSILYVGGNNPANVDGVTRFLDKIWPLIQAEFPEARPRICGYIAQSFDPGDYPDVDFLGHVPDIEEEYARAALVVNPIWLGTGLKIKTVEAIARGCPLVTMDKGIEGMDASVREACCLAESDAAFAEAVCQLLKDPETRARLGRAASVFHRKHLSLEAVYQDLIACLKR